MSKLMHRKEREAQLKRQAIYRCVWTGIKWLCELLALLYCAVTPFVLLSNIDALGGVWTFAMGIVWAATAFGLLFILSWEGKQ